MPEKKGGPLSRMLKPAVPLTLKVMEGDRLVSRTFQLSFDMNAGAAMQEKTADTVIDKDERGVEIRGVCLTYPNFWLHVAEPRVLRVVFWGALLARQPGFADKDGLELAGSMIDEETAHPIIAALWEAYRQYVPKWRRDEMDANKAKLEAEQYAKGKGATEDEAPLAESESDSTNSGALLDTTSESATKISAN